MSIRPSLRLFHASRSVFRQPVLRRRIQTAADGNAETKTAFAKFMDSPVGPKTVHFWAPIMKWGIVIAGIADLSRPAESLSLNTNAALMATGAIWTRWCLIIKPKNIFLATVNFFLFCTGAMQTTRIFLWRRSQQTSTVPEEAKKEAKKVADVAAEKVGLKN